MATLTRTIRSKSLSKWSRGFAQVVPGLLVKPTLQEQRSQGGISKFDKFLLSHLENAASSSNHTALILEQYETNRGKELNMELRQSGKRLQVDSTTCPIYLVAHVASNGARNKICISSGFKLQTQGGHGPMVLTCAHTLEEMRFSEILEPPSTVSNTFIVSDDGTCSTATSIASAMPRHDLLLLLCEDSSPLRHDGVFPVSFYPSPIGTKVAAHFVVEHKPELESKGWIPSFGGMLLRKWVEGEVVGYRDFAGNKAKPGTYDSLAHMFFSAIPTPGSSGGPIVDLETGSIVGVIRGSRLDNRVTGLRGWATSSESIYEMFTLPGVNANR